MKGRALKKTYTYATLPSVKEKAAILANKEGLTLSEKIDEFLKLYVKGGAYRTETAYFDSMGNLLVQETNKKKK